MKALICMGSPRKHGNTAALLTPFREELEKNHLETEVIWLYDKHIEPCIACRECQKDWTIPNCARQDDCEEIFPKILAADLLVMATPIYIWYCTPPMKALLDRLGYAMNKYYGEKKGPSLWKGKALALLTTCGYPPEKGCDLLEEGLRRACKHSQLRYLGSHAERHMGYDTVFMDSEKDARTREFARELIQKL